MISNEKIGNSVPACKKTDDTEPRPQANEEGGGEKMAGKANGFQDAKQAGTGCMQPALSSHDVFNPESDPFEDLSQDPGIADHDDSFDDLFLDPPHAASPRNNMSVGTSGSISYEHRINRDGTVFFVSAKPKPKPKATARIDVTDSALETVQLTPQTLPHTRASRFFQFASTSEHVARLGISMEHVTRAVSTFTTIPSASLLGHADYVVVDGGNCDISEEGHDTF